MLGALIGDIAGSRFEWHNIKTKDFELLTHIHRCKPTDDSIMSLAVAKAILNSNGNLSTLSNEAVKCMQELGKKYPHAGYGWHFRQWIYDTNPQPYKSWGNGSAMRVSAAGFAAKTLDEAIALSKAVTEVTHNHPEGMKGAEATAVAIFMAKSGSSLMDIQDHINKHYYKITFKLDDIRAGYDFDVSCQGSVPQALEAFFESTGFEDAIRNAVSIGGDSDTIAAITGGIAEAYYGIPDEIRKNALTFLDNYQLQILNAFEAKYGMTVEKATGNDISRPVAFQPERQKESADAKTAAFDMADAAQRSEDTVD